MDLVLIKSHNYVNNLIAKWADQYFQDNPVDQAAKYALLSPGKRLRSILLLAAAHTQSESPYVDDVIVAIEMLHAASLIADDLPIMDNSSERRGQDAAHVKFSEATALLASYSLLFHAYELIAKNSSHLPSKKITSIIEITSKYCKEASLSQHLDLTAQKPDLEMILKIMEGKTATLFYISLSLGAYIANPDFSDDSLIEQLAYHFGIAYQILDDLEDRDDSDLNILSVLSFEDALNKAIEHLNLIDHILIQLDWSTPEFAAIVKRLYNKKDALVICK